MKIELLAGKEQLGYKEKALEVAQRVKDSVVKLDTDPALVGQGAQGTGFFTEWGICTAGHILKGIQSNGRIQGTIQYQYLDSNKWLPANPSEVYKHGDLAVLKPEGTPRQMVKWGEIGNLKKGDPLIILSNPIGVEGSTQYPYVAIGEVIDPYRIFADYFHYSAPIRAGSSGAAVFGLDGLCYGLHTIGYTDGGGQTIFGSGIHADALQEVLAKEEGKVTQKAVEPYLYVGGFSITIYSLLALAGVLAVKKLT